MELLLSKGFGMEPKDFSPSVACLVGAPGSFVAGEKGSVMVVAREKGTFFGLGSSGRAA